MRRLLVPGVVFVAFCLGIVFLTTEQTKEGLAGSLGYFASLLPFILGVGAFLSLAFLLDRLVKMALWDGFLRNSQRPVPRLIVQITTFVIYLLAAICIVGFVFGQSVTGFFATSGVVGVILGFALRSLILDVFSGVAMNIDQPFQMGDWVEVRLRGLPAFTGRVLELHWRTARLIDPFGNLIVIPNSQLAGAVVQNFTKPTVASMFDVLVWLDFDVPEARAVQILRGAVLSATEKPGMLKTPPPAVRVQTIEDYRVQYRVFFHIDRSQIGPLVARDNVNRAILDQLHRGGLAPAVPKRDIFQSSMPERMLDSQRLADRKTLLARVELFAGMEDEDITLLAEGAVVRRFGEGETVIAQGEEGDSMFIVIEGLLQVLVTRPGEDKPVPVAQVFAGSFFGEMSLLTGAPRSVTVRALTDASCFEVQKDVMTGIFERRPEIATRIGRRVARRQTQNDARLADATQEEQDAHTQSRAQEILARMRRFFGRVI